MSTTEFELRMDERSRFEQELLMPFAAIVSVAVVILFATAGAVPGQFAGSRFHIPAWGAIVAVCVLFMVWVLRLQRPKKYFLTDEGLEICSTIVTYQIPYSEITEVISVADRRPQPLFTAVVLGTGARFKAAVTQLLGRVRGGSGFISIGSERHNFTTSDTGGAKIVTRTGGEALVSPMELSAFLRQIEREFSLHGLSGHVVREVAVSITPSSRD